MDETEKKRDTLRKECFDLCIGCRHGHPLDLATGTHTKRHACHASDKSEIEEILGRPLTNEEIARKCIHCKAGLPLENGKHLQVTPCTVIAQRKELVALGGHSITEVE